MRKFKQNKLWRDKLPNRAIEKGSIIHLKHLNDEEFDQELRLKLIEEAMEVKNAKSKQEIIEELSDVYEVVETLAELYDTSIEEILKTKMKKKEERGGFRERKFVAYAEHPAGSYLEKYCLENLEKYPEEHS